MATDPPKQPGHTPHGATPIGPSAGADVLCDAHSLTVTQVAAHSWLVRQEPHAQCPGGLLGRVEEREHDFDAMQIGDGFHWEPFTTLGAAVAHLISHQPASSDERENHHCGARIDQFAETGGTTSSTVNRAEVHRGPVPLW
jgi:hypothetical protein